MQMIHLSFCLHLISNAAKAMPPSPSFLIFLFIKYIFDTLFLSIICVWLKGSIICFCDLVLLAQTGWSLMSNNINNNFHYGPSV